MQAEGLFPLAGVEVVFQDYASKPYPQVGGKNGFVPHLSVLDALFNIGPEATSEMISHGTARWRTWDEMVAAGNAHADSPGEPQETTL